jgi:class 3 adenylate cyclase
MQLVDRRWTRVTDCDVVDHSGSLRECAAEAMQRRDWPEVLRALRAADASELTAAELWTLVEAEMAAGGGPRECRPALELAHAAYVRDGDMEGASWTALVLMFGAFANSEHELGNAWMVTLGRLMDGLPECKVHVLLSIVVSFLSIDAGEFESTIASMQQAQELARKLGEQGLEVWARQREAIATVRSGEFDRGLAMLDETMVGTLSIDLSPLVRGALLCHGVSLCQQVGDSKRAGWWIEAGDRATSACGLNFSGECHMHRAEVLKSQGSLARAEAEARLGCEGYLNDNHHLGWGWVQVGEIRLRVGDLDGAEDAFTVAYSKDYLPDPGLALLRMAQGKVDHAAKEINRALEHLAIDKPRRVNLLAAAVTIRIAAGDPDGAAAACDELIELSEVFTSDTFAATATCARGELRSAEGHHEDAVRLLRSGISHWIEIGAPYEAAIARIHLAEAMAALGDLDDARMELKVAGRALQELGAEREEQRVAALLAALGGTAEDDTSGGPRVDKVFMFTDIESSTALATAMGEDEWDRVLRWHDRQLGDCISENAGVVVKHEGDGVFAAFADPSAAVTAAVAIQERLAAHRQQHGFAPAVRIGIHAGPAIERGGDYFGMAVNTAARVMTLAAGGQIMASESLADACGPRAGEVRSVELKGLGAPTTVVTVNWQQ